MEKNNVIPMERAYVPFDGLMERVLPEAKKASDKSERRRAFAMGFNLCRDLVMRNIRKEKPVEISPVRISGPEHDMAEVIKNLKKLGQIRLAPMEAPKIEIIPKWIPAEEAMPEPFETVLIHAFAEGDDGHYITIGQFCGTTGNWEDFVSVAFEFKDYETVTHWMPLPAPPEVSHQADTGDEE